MDTRQITEDYTCVDFLNEEFNMCIKYDVVFTPDAVEELLKFNNYEPVELPQKGDLIIFYVIGEFHIGVMINEIEFKHLQANRGVVVDLLDTKWRRRLYGIYRQNKKPTN